jgi:hypothetical protein
MVYSLNPLGQAAGRIVNVAIGIPPVGTHFFIVVRDSAARATAWRGLRTHWTFAVELCDLGVASPAEQADMAPHKPHTTATSGTHCQMAGLCGCPSRRRLLDAIERVQPGCLQPVTLSSETS